MQSSVSCTVGRSCIARRLGKQGSAAILSSARRSFPRRLGRQVTTGRKRHHDYDDTEEYAQQQYYEEGISPTPPPTLQERRIPLSVSIPGVLLVAFLALRIFKKLQSRGSVTGLVSRGLVNEEKGTNKGDPYYKDMMKHVNTMHMEELSDDQIAAARARRSKERDAPTIDIDKMELPDNHPFAVKKKVSRDEEELTRKRLEVKRGLPLQDLTGKRGFPEDPRLAANQKMQAEAQKLDEQAARAREARLARQAAAQRQQQQQK